LLITILVTLGVLRASSTPNPIGADAPDVVFSAIRAEAILRELLAENRPHVAGSPENRVVRDRVLAQLANAGYEAEIQSRFHCNPLFGTCSPVENIIAVKPGSVGKHAVLLTAHYDSGWAGPGAADDGSGTAAILEIARMASNFPPFENDVIFLITDSEENGLIGAEAFAEHHPLFERVKAVINLEARGVSGPSAMFETGDGNRSVIRMLSKNLDRPVANSLTYEIYKRMPNDTDYSVYRSRGVMGVNFAFVQGVALYHSRLDTPDHLDLGSLQHHGDNAWSMLTALGDRDLNRISHQEDAGYIDLFGTRLVHYPLSIAGGLTLFFGIWTMLSIGLAFRKDFRFRQLRWGLLAVPMLAVGLFVAGYLLSWPLGRWPDLHPLEHPYPWAGRLTLFLGVGLVIYATLKVFSGRVSACAWMIIAWALVFVLGMVLTSRLPGATHLALLPLAMFALGSVIDLFRKKSPAPLLMASLFGFGTAVYISLYHFFLLDVVMNFDRSELRIMTLFLLALVVMPMLLAYVRHRELSWQPARWVLVAILAGCFIHLFLPGYTADRPRDMSLMYREVENSEAGHIVLESFYRRHDREYAARHGFEPVELNDGALGTTERPALDIPALGLTGIVMEHRVAEEDGGKYRHRLLLTPAPGSPFLKLAFGKDPGVEMAWVNGVLALDSSIQSKHGRYGGSLRLVNTGSDPFTIEVLVSSAAPLRVAAVSWHGLPGVLTAPFMGNWPDDAQPFRAGPRAERVQEFTLGGAE
jgi:hypothetical protein